MQREWSYTLGNVWKNEDVVASVPTCYDNTYSYNNS